MSRGERQRCSSWYLRPNPIALLLLVVFEVATGEYKFAALQESASTLRVDNTGTTNMGSHATGAVLSYSTPTVVIGQTGHLFEWSNFVFAGREFANRAVRDNPVRIYIFAIEADASVTIRVDGSDWTTQTVAASTAQLFEGDHQNKDVEISSSEDVMVAISSKSHEYSPVPPVAQTIYGQCSKRCELCIWGGDKNVNIQRRCTNGSIDFVNARRYTQSSGNYNGDTCKWTAPNGYKIAGTAGSDGAGWEATALVPAEHFQLVTPLPTYMRFVLLVSTGPAQCTYGPNSITLTGANGVYHGRIPQVDAATVFECDTPVTAIGDADCPTAEFGSTCKQKEMNLIVAALTTTTTTTTVTTTSTITSTNTTTTNTTTTTSVSTSTTTSNTTTTTSTATTSSTTTVSITTTSATTTNTTTTSSRTTSRTTPTTTTASSTTTTSTTTTTTTCTSTATETTLTATTLTFTNTTHTSTATTTHTTTTASSTATTTSTNTSTITSTTHSATNTTATDTATVSTSTTSTATTATVIESEAPPAATALVDRVELLEASILPAFITGNLTSTAVRVDGLSLVAQKIDVQAAVADGDLIVPLEDGSVTVTLPASLFAILGLDEGGVVLTAATMDPTEAGFMGSAGESEVQVLAVVNVNLRSLAGRRIRVAGLVDPITVVMPANRSDGLQCVFWNESRWATQGVQLGSADDGFVECKSSHLTLFAAIARGFVNTFRCSQVMLLNSESLQELGSGNWHRTPGAVVLWILLATFLLLLCLAACLDWTRWRQGKYDDEHFLISQEGKQKDVRLELQQQEEDNSKSQAKEVKREFFACTVCVAGITMFFDWCRSSAAVRDALDEVCSSWLEYFGEIRDFVEGLTEGLELNNGNNTGEGRVAVVVHRIMSRTLVISARRQAAASLGISCNVSALVMEDEDMFDVLLAHRMRKPGDSDAVLPPERNFSKELAREDTWGQLHRAVEAKLDTYMEGSARWSSLPGTVWRLFLHQNPFGACLVHCAFTSSKMRVLLFMVDVMGALMLATVFFTASGVPRKRSRRLDCNFDDPLEFLGRVIAIATGSVFIAGIPTTLLGSLCTRGLKKFDYEGCPAWNRQLKIWRIQDKAVWIIGLGYLAFCVFFVALFLANVDGDDHGDWLLGGLVSVVEDIILIPLTVAITLPLIAAACLHFVSFHRRVNKEALISERHMQFKREGNMTMPVERI